MDILQKIWSKIRPLIELFLSFGTEHYPPETRRRLRVMNAVAYLIIIATLAYSVQHLLHADIKLMPVAIINIALVFVAAWVPFAHRYNEIAGGMLLIIAEYSAQFAFSAYYGHGAGMQMHYFVGAAAPFVILGLHRKKLALALVLSGVGLHLLSWKLFPASRALINVDTEMLEHLYVNATVTTTALIAASVYYAYALVERAQGEVEKLLRNILPVSIIARLNAKPDEVIADHYESASVLFLDICGFTPLALKLGPGETVKILNELVTEFDQVSARFGAEKIKTIGDAYMAASGIPEIDENHLQKLAKTALALQTVVKRVALLNNIKIEARIGIATGPLTAGVIGTHKFSYDIWGDTVNLASRMESTGKPGFIQVPSGVKSALENDFIFESAGNIPVKGFGEITTYYLIDTKKS